MSSTLPLPYRDASLGVAAGALVLVPVSLDGGSAAFFSSLVLVPGLAALFALRAAVLEVVGHRGGAAARGPSSPCDWRIAARELALAAAAVAAAVGLHTAL